MEEESRGGRALGGVLGGDPRTAGRLRSERSEEWGGAARRSRAELYLVIARGSSLSSDPSSGG